MKEVSELLATLALTEQTEEKGQAKTLPQAIAVEVTKSEE
jgi:hypothetical protein